MNYPENMSTDTAATPQRTGNARAWTIFYIAAVVVANLVRQLADLSWWVFWVPAVAISIVILLYAWAKRRRSEAAAVGSGS